MIRIEPIGAADFGGEAFLSGAEPALLAEGAGETTTSVNCDVRPCADLPTYGAALLYEGWLFRGAAHCDHLSLFALTFHRHPTIESIFLRKMVNLYHSGRIAKFTHLFKKLERMSLDWFE